MPRLIPEAFADSLPARITYDRNAAWGKIAFIKRALVHSCSDDRIDLVICGHLHLLPAAVMLSRCHRARLALIIHGVEAWSPSNSAPANYFASTIDSVLAVSRLSADRFVSWSGLPPANISVLPNCVDLDRFQPAERDPALVARYGLRPSKVILTVGRLASEERSKGFDEVIDVMPQLLTQFPTLKYLIVGDGPDRPRLERKAAAAGVSAAVIFAGRIPEAEKIAHYSLADAYVMPSSGEGFGIVLIEAAACGVPIVGSSADGSREALLKGRLGLLVDPKKPAELVVAIATTLNNPGPHKRLDAIEEFSVGNFRGKVGAWLTEQGRILASRRITKQNALEGVSASV